MKLLVAAAVAAFALPAFAQDTPAAAPPAPEPQTAPAPMPPADPAAAPAPMSAPAPMAAPMAPPATTDGNYPPCTRTVTDHCTERSNARGERLHSTPRKPV